MRVEHRALIQAPIEQVWETIADWRTHPEWQPTLVDVDAPPGLGEGVQLVEVRASHGQRLTFDVVLTEWEARRRVRAAGKSRGVVSVRADLVYELEPGDRGTDVTLAVEADVPFVLLPLRHAVQTETEKELVETLRLLAAYQQARAPS